jgi:hypothetical protein
LDKLIPGLVLAILSGVTFVAYRHPAAYIYFHAALVGALVLGIMAVSVWEFGTTVAYSRLIEFIKPESRSDAHKKIEKLRLIKGWTWAAFFGLILYLQFLSYLPRLLGEY